MNRLEKLQKHLESKKDEVGLILFNDFVDQLRDELTRWNNATDDFLKVKAENGNESQKEQ